MGPDFSKRKCIAVSWAEFFIELIGPKKSYFNSYKKRSGQTFFQQKYGKKSDRIFKSAYQCHFFFTFSSSDLRNTHSIITSSKPCLKFLIFVHKKILRNINYFMSPFTPRLLSKQKSQILFPPLLKSIPCVSKRMLVTLLLK